MRLSDKSEGKRPINMNVTDQHSAKIYSLPQSETPQYLVWLLWAGLLVGAVMLLIAPLNKPIWDDELDSVMQGSKSYLTILAGASDTQPPLHFLLLRLCESFVGKNLAVFRVVSAIPSVIALWYVYLLGKRIDFKVGVLAVWLAALSPGIILFDRMARYHGLLAMLATMCVYYGMTSLETGRRRDIVAYGITTFLMLITYYLSLFVLIAQAVVLLWQRRKQPYFKPVFISVSLGVAAFLPWFLHGLLLARHNINLGHVEDPAMSLGFHGFLLRLGLPLYSFVFGETVNPWVWPIVIIGLIALPVSFWLGGRRLLTRPDAVLIAVVLGVAILSAAATSGPLGNGQTVGSMSKRVSYVLPLLYVIVSAGVFSLRLRFLQSVCCCALFLVSGYAVTNYWQDRQFLNQNYIAQWTQAIDMMQKRQWGPDTLVISMSDPALHYYLEQQHSVAPNLNVRDESEIDKTLQTVRPRYIWLVGRDRGDRVAVKGTQDWEQRFSERYHHVETISLMPRSASDRHWLQKVLKRPASPAYLWMDLYDTKTNKLSALHKSSTPALSQPSEQ